MKSISNQAHSDIIRLLEVFVERLQAGNDKQANERRKAKKLIKYLKRNEL